MELLTYINIAIRLYNEEMTRIALFAGSFDPPTLGHLDIIHRATKLVDRLIIGIALKHSKQPLLSTEEKVDLLRTLTKKFPTVEVAPFEGLAVDFARQHKASFLIRGLRPYIDLAHEFQMALANRQLAGLETLFLLGDERLSHISSTLIREIAAAKGPLHEFVPPEVDAFLKK